MRALTDEVIVDFHTLANELSGLNNMTNGKWHLFAFLAVVAYSDRYLKYLARSMDIVRKTNRCPDN